MLANSLSTAVATLILATTNCLASIVQRSGLINDYSCKSSHNPVVMLHGLGGSQDTELNFLEAWLKPLGYCMYALTYGSVAPYPFGGLTYINQSSPSIASFIKQVQQKTGVSKVDLVGHSEGGFQALYTPKFQDGIAGIVDVIVAIAPPTHGSTLSGLYNLAIALGDQVQAGADKVLQQIGCVACTDLVVGGGAVKRLNDGTIVQKGNTVTVIMSKTDEAVTPATNAFVEESGVSNIYVQDYCPFDVEGHLSETISTNVFNLVLNSLQKKIGRRFFCVEPPPGRH